MNSFDHCYTAALFTWKILGAETKKPSADDKVAAKIPIVIKCPDPETKLSI